MFFYFCRQRFTRWGPNIGAQGPKTSGGQNGTRWQCTPSPQEPGCRSRNQSDQLVMEGTDFGPELPIKCQRRPGQPEPLWSVRRYVGTYLGTLVHCWSLVLCMKPP